LLPALSGIKLRKLARVKLQAYFNSLVGRLAPKTVKLIHATLRAAEEFFSNGHA
jgi:hypothetical protein